MKNIIVKTAVFAMLLSAPIFAQDNSVASVADTATPAEHSVNTTTVVPTPVATPVAPTVAAEEEKSKVLHRFGMTFDLGGGDGMSGGYSFYVANDYGDMISFGTSGQMSLGYVAYTGPYGHEHRLPGIESSTAGLFLGYGKLYQTSYDPALHLGYLFNFHAGAAWNKPDSLLGGAYVGFEPGFILTKNKFMYKLSLYGDTTRNFSGRMGFGFMLK